MKKSAWRNNAYNEDYNYEEMSMTRHTMKILIMKKWAWHNNAYNEDYNYEEMSMT